MERQRIIVGINREVVAWNSNPHLYNYSKNFTFQFENLDYVSRYYVLISTELHPLASSPWNSNGSNVQYRNLLHSYEYILKLTLECTIAISILINENKINSVDIGMVYKLSNYFLNSPGIKGIRIKNNDAHKELQTIINAIIPYTTLNLHSFFILFILIHSYFG